MYSLVNAPVVVFDAGRMPTGAVFAADLLSALALDTKAMGPLDVVARELPERDLDGLPEALTVGAALAELRADFAEQVVTSETAARHVTRLSSSSFAGREQVADFVVEDVLDWTRHRIAGRPVQRYAYGVRLVSQVVAASHAGDVEPSPWRDTWDRLRPALPRTTGLPNEVDTKLATLAASLTPEALADLDARGELRPGAADRTTSETGPESWSVLVHQATRALHFTDRLRAAMLAQLRAVVAIRAVHPEPAPLDALSAISGAVQAWACRDVLEDERYAALVAPVQDVLGIG